jgi:hypothetical protein
VRRNGWGVEGGSDKAVPPVSSEEKEKEKERKPERERGASWVGWPGWAVALLGPGRGPVGWSFSFFFCSFFYSFLFCDLSCNFYILAPYELKPSSKFF